MCIPPQWPFFVEYVLDKRASVDCILYSVSSETEVLLECWGDYYQALIGICITNVGENENKEST